MLSRISQLIMVASSIYKIETRLFGGVNL